MPAVAQYPDFSFYVDDMVNNEAFLANPLLPLQTIAERCGAVAVGKRGEFAGVPYPDIFTPPGSDEDVYLALSFEACKKVVTNHRVFLSGPAYEDTLSVTAPGAIVTLDGEEHRRSKKLIMPTFTHRSANADLQPMLEKIIGEAIDAIADRGAAELMRDFTSQFPWRVIATLFGLPFEQREACESAGSDAQKGVTDPVAAQKAIDNFHRIYQKIIDDHRADIAKGNPKDDLTTRLINTTIDGDKMSDPEIRAFLINLVSAGLDTTHRQTAILIAQLLDNPDQFALLREQPDLLEQAIWESLRCCPTTGSYARVAGEDCKVEGVVIPKGARVLICQYSANNDPSRWEDPLRFDISRKPQPSLAFNLGNHSCLGQSLALAEMRKDEERWQSVKWRGYHFRAPTQLPVRWDV